MDWARVYFFSAGLTSDMLSSVRYRALDISARSDLYCGVGWGKRQVRLQVNGLVKDVTTKFIS